MHIKINKIVTSKLFEYTILLIIIINSFVISIDTIFSFDPETTKLLNNIDLVCIGIFVIEAILRIIALRIKYFKSYWNLFDFIIVLIAIIPISNFISVLRSLRIIRAFRLIAHVKSLKRVVAALSISIPGLLATACLLLLVFFVFGVMGVKLFGTQFPVWFGHLGKSMFSLFQIMTLESWSMGIVRPIMESDPYAWLFFIPFILISAFTLLNLLIGIVVDAIAHLKHSEAEEGKHLTMQDIIVKLDAIESFLKNGK